MSTSHQGNNGHNSGNNDTRDKSRDWPQTVDEAVERILQGMSDADKQLLRSTPKDDLIQFHFGWGMGIRNNFGLWGGNASLMRSCAAASGQAFMHPDDASMVIIEAVWRWLRTVQ